MKNTTKKPKIQKIPDTMGTSAQQFQEETALILIPMSALRFGRKLCSEANSSLMFN